MSEKLVNGIIGAFGGLTAIAFGKRNISIYNIITTNSRAKRRTACGSTFRLDPIPSYIISIVEIYFQYHLYYY